MIRVVETIVVEGRDDCAAVLSSVAADIIITHGFRIRKSTAERIKRAARNTGVVIFTDPDFAGERIRRMIEEMFQSSERVLPSDPCPAAGDRPPLILKHARLVREDALRGTDIGVENATPEAILYALRTAGARFEEDLDSGSEVLVSDSPQPLISGGQDLVFADLYRLRLAGEGSKARRTKIGRKLGIGYANAKQFLVRLSLRKIGRAELEELMEKLE